MTHDNTSFLSSLGTAARRLARQGFRRLGLHVQRYTPVAVPGALVHTLIANQHIDLVLDVGANAGQYARSLREAGYQGEILSFEPLRDAWTQCAAHASHDPRWTLAPRMALGARETQIDIHVAKNSASSSILPMRDLHRQAAPQSAYVSRESVDLRRLDRVAAEAVARAARPLLKIDTQGYELEVLDGASGLLDRIHGVQVEMSLAPLYDNGPLMRDVLGFLEERGFAPYAILPEFIDSRSGRMLQVEGVFFRDAAGSSVRAIASNGHTSRS